MAAQNAFIGIEHLTEEELAQIPKHARSEPNLLPTITSKRPSAAAKSGANLVMLQDLPRGAV
ncbi:hypothetical protein HMPREF9946_05226 [Acetobacteraceae bacterium AT-5844]|nr:hypothetical protein HMPREF9946_05226 [Acetobacteraceae bacterium AT-5844]